MGTLKYQTVNVNAVRTIKAIIHAVQIELSDARNYSALEFHPPYYFKTTKPLAADAGWYIILDHRTPIYVGDAVNFNGRLNTRHGSCDNFAKKARTSDSQRNVIKKLSEIGLLTTLRVVLVSQARVIDKVKLTAATFTNGDRKNVEKLLNIYRGKLNYL